MFQKGLNNETPAVRWFSFPLQKCLGSTAKKMLSLPEETQGADLRRKNLRLQTPR